MHIARQKENIIKAQDVDLITNMGMSLGSMGTFGNLLNIIIRAFK